MTAFNKVKKNKVGRPPKLSLELIEEVCKLVRGGAYIETAVVLCDIDKTSFYRWIKESHLVDNKKQPSPKVGSKQHKMTIEFRNAVAKAIEESTMRDVMNIDRSAMGQPTVYAKHPKNTVIPLVDDRGRVQTDDHGNQIDVDVSGHVITDLKGKPVVSIQGQAPDWKASAWRLEKRAPKDWGQTSTLIIEKEDHLKNKDEDDPNKIEFVWCDPEDGNPDE